MQKPAQGTKSWMEIVLIPIVIAIVGTVSTYLITKLQSENTARTIQAQINSSERIAQAQIQRGKIEQQIKILDIFSEKILSDDDKQRILALKLLRVVDQDLAIALTGVVADDKTESKTVRKAARKELEKRLKINVAINPPSISPGEKTALTTTVQDSLGNPVLNATVVFSAGGGRYLSQTEKYDPKSRLHGPYQTVGRTGMDGKFTTWWVCNPCAPAYVMGVESSKEDYISTKKSIKVSLK